MQVMESGFCKETDATKRPPVMLDHPFSTLLLAPLLLAQGLYTRKVTPKLPEPEGARCGVAGSGHLLKLLIVGDSAAAGVVARHQQNALSGRLVERLSEHHEVHWQLNATTGHKTRDAIQGLARLTPYPVDVALISLGVNDVTSTHRVRLWLDHMAELNQLLTERFDCRQVLYTSVPPMHLFPALPQPLRWYLGRKAQLFNRHLAESASTWPSSRILSIPFPLTPEFIAQDGFHPSEAAYRIWADAAAREIVQGRASQVHFNSR